MAKLLGRTFNHLEDLVFFHGSAGITEALEHIKEITTKEGGQSLRMKWDGNPQIYWGRTQVDGPLILAGHNGWSRGVASSDSDKVYDFIANQSGSPSIERNIFARKFADLHGMFDNATPKNFVGFVYADGLFLNTPIEQEGVFSINANPKTNTTYHVDASGMLGQRISKSTAMVVGHAFFPVFGMPDSEQQPVDDFSIFNSTQELIVQGPLYNTQPILVNIDEISIIEELVFQHSDEIDAFLEGAPGLSDLKNIIYTFVNQTAKLKQLNRLDVSLFVDWLGISKVSINKQRKIHLLLQQYKNALLIIFKLVRQIMDLKDLIIDQIESGDKGEIWDTNGEGRVRYAGKNKQFGNIKLVPRKRWTPV
jgi:hypothetical protein